MFGTIDYTYCTREMSLNGLPGWQLSACSEHLDSDDRNRVTEKYFHALPSKDYPDIDMRDPSTHPRTVLFDENGGRFYLANGKSIPELQGTTRPGNHFTRVLVTTEPEDFYWTSPAQTLCIEELWVQPLSATPGKLGSKAAPSQSQTPDELIRYFRGKTWFWDNFAVMLTLIEKTLEPSGPRVFIQTDDEVEFLNCLALFSFFLSRPQQLRLTFRMGTYNPESESYRVIGVHPAVLADLHGFDLAQTNESFIDLIGQGMSDIKPSPTATRVVDWLNSHDSGDVIRTVEQLREWETYMESTVAVEAVRTILLGEKGNEFTGAVIQALVAFSRVSPENDSVAAWVADCTDYLLQAGTAVGELVDVSRSLIVGGHVGAGVHILNEVVRRSIGKPSDIARVIGPPGYWAEALPVLSSADRGDWAEERIAELRRSLVSIGAYGDDFRSESIGGYLSLLKAVNRGEEIRIDLNLYDRQARLLADNPALSTSVHEWEEGDLIFDAARNLLLTDLLTNQSPLTMGVARGEYDSFLSQQYSHDLDTWILVAQLRREHHGDEGRALNSGLHKLASRSTIENWWPFFHDLDGNVDFTGGLEWLRAQRSCPVSLGDAIATWYQQNPAQLARILEFLVARPSMSASRELSRILDQFHVVRHELANLQGRRKPSEIRRLTPQELFLHLEIIVKTAWQHADLVICEELIRTLYDANLQNQTHMETRRQIEEKVPGVLRNVASTVQMNVKVPDSADCARSTLAMITPLVLRRLAKEDGRDTSALVDEYLSGRSSSEKLKDTFESARNLLSPFGSRKKTGKGR